MEPGPGAVQGGADQHVDLILLLDTGDPGFHLKGQDGIDVLGRGPLGNLELPRASTETMAMKSRPGEVAKCCRAR